MGACDFIHASVNEPNVRKAFDTAVAQAQYDYGHAGYTGSIAEKNDYVVIGEGFTFTYEDAMLRVRDLMDKDDSRISDKWGPAGAIRFTGPTPYDASADGGWLFFGWASS